MSRPNAQTILPRKLCRKLRWPRHHFRSNIRTNTWNVETILATVAGEIIPVGVSIPMERGRAMWFRMEILQRWMQPQPTLASVKAPKSTTTRIGTIAGAIVTIMGTTIEEITIMGTIGMHPHRLETPPPQTVALARRT